MKKVRMLAIIFMLLMITVSASAAPNLFSVEQATGDTVLINSTGGFEGLRQAVEIVTTSDTLTRNESGKNFFVNNSTGWVYFTLPIAQAGLHYRFVAIAGNGDSTLGKIVLQPNAIDAFVGCVNDGAVTTFVAGDEIRSASATGDMLEIIANNGNNWTCVDRQGTWADNGQ